MQFIMQIIGPDRGPYEGQDLLPAPSAELDDVLFNAAQSYDCEPDNLDLQYRCSEVGIYGTLRPGESLAELNFLALRLEHFPPDLLEDYRIGLASLKQPSVEELINLSYSLDERDQFRANTDSDIGWEIIRRGLITVPEELNDCIDRAALGKKYRGDNGGRLVNGWYVSGPGKELKEVYHSEELRQGQKWPFPDALQGIDCTIKVQLFPAAAPEHPPEDGVWLKLPATVAATSLALERLGVSSLEECLIYSIDSTVPEIRGSSAQINELDQLTELAEKLQGLNQSNLDIYNAVLAWELESTRPRPADFLNYLCNFEYYELDTRIQDDYELGQHLLKCEHYQLSSDLHEYFNFEQYVKDMQDQYPGAIVSGGYISRSVPKSQLELPYQPPDEAALAMGLCQG